MDKLTVNELKNLLNDYNINEHEIVGTGKHGHIIKHDIIDKINSKAQLLKIGDIIFHFFIKMMK